MPESVNVGVGPIKAAVEKFGARTPIGSALRSAEWARMPLAFRERSFFSAGVENVRALQTMHRELAADLAMERDESGGWRDRSTFIAKTRSMVAGLRNEAGGLRSDLGDFNGPVGDPRSLTDLASRARAGLIYDMAVKSSAGYARWVTDNDPDILDAFPAQELIRITPRLNPRDWQARWKDNGGRLVDGGRMVALKTDSIWTKISAFGTPWPPFDYGSGMGLQDLDRDEAEALGLLRKGDIIQPTQAEDFNASLQASTEGLTSMFTDSLRLIFGDKIEIKAAGIRWIGTKGGTP